MDRKPSQTASMLNLFYFVGIPGSIVLLICTLVLWARLNYSASFFAKITVALPDIVLGLGVVISLLFLLGCYFFSENKRSKRESEKLTNRLQKILETVNEGFITIDDHYRVLYINAYAEKMLGWKSADALGKNIQHIVIPERYQQQHKEAMDRYFTHGDDSVMNKEIEFLAVTKKGREFPVAIILFPVEEDGHIIFHAFVRDISARKKAEIDKARYVTIVAASDDAIISADIAGMIKTWNPAAHRLFGYSEKEAIGQPVSLIYEEKSTMHPLLDILKKGSPLNLETNRRRKNGEIFPASVLISPIKNSVGQVIGGTSITRDITERKKIEKMKNEFISIVSHELRTPLTSIRGSLGILESGKVMPINEKTTQLLKIAISNCERLIRLINDMLDIEKISAGKMNFHFQPVNLYGLLEMTIASAQVMANRKNINVILSGDKNIVIVGDQDRLIQVVTNLLSNAINHSFPNSEIDILLEKHQHHARVSVKDFGTGIPYNFRNKVFSKFSQADSSDSRKGGGTGLGLNISKAIIEHHHGNIDFETTEGQGTTFYFDLPYHG